MHWMWVPVCLALIVLLYILFWRVFFKIRIERIKRWVEKQDR